jgi:hypothetical protein
MIRTPTAIPAERALNGPIEGKIGSKTCGRRNVTAKNP